MFGKIFESIYDSSIAEDWRVMIVFQQFIILADRNGVVDMTYTALSRRTNLPLEFYEYAIPILEDIDPNSRNPDLEGRRLLRLSDHRDWGWVVTNYENYMKQSTLEAHRHYMREQMRSTRGSAGDRRRRPSGVLTDKQQEFFDAFYEKYPKKRAPVDAEKAWKKLDPDLDMFEEIMDGVDRGIESKEWAEQDGKFIPYPATFLNQGQWENEFEPAGSLSDKGGTTARAGKNWIAGQNG